VQQELQQEIMDRRKQNQQSESAKNVSAETFTIKGSYASSDTPVNTTGDTQKQTLDVNDPKDTQDTYNHTRADALVTMAERFLETRDYGMAIDGLLQRDGKLYRSPAR
jgi:hypothetical protein